MGVYPWVDREVHSLRECLKALLSFKSVFKRIVGSLISRKQKYISTCNMGYNIFGSPRPFWISDEGYKTFLHKMHILHFAYNFTKSLKLIKKDLLVYCPQVKDPDWKVLWAYVSISTVDLGGQNHRCYRILW